MKKRRIDDGNDCKTPSVSHMGMDIDSTILAGTPDYSDVDPPQC